MMKAGVGHGTAEVVSIFVPTSLKGHCQIKRAAGYLTRTRRNDPGIRFRRRYSNAALMWMSGKVFDQTGRRGGILHQLMDRFDRGDALVITITARMVIRPGDRS